ncbi:hypothetical protein CsSME_00032246 [Camellia sinensis var. sinensis]
MVDSVDTSELPIIDFDKILVATHNFSTTNKLGEGGFGPVYKGRLEDGHQVAVKRLSRHSGQGVEEFKNEIVLISKLQHRNLVRLLGCCIEGEEKVLVYEYMTNKSLDTFLFDATKRVKLDWATRFHIIQGIARGLLYLHRDSCLRVIHRDLKASNILLDNDMNPKISDFGLAQTFRVTQELANTHREPLFYTLHPNKQTTRNTYILFIYWKYYNFGGYMSPEYAMGGLFSEKSDVYSFGVLLLEMVTWELYNEGQASDVVDEDHVADRPTVSIVVLMLSNEMDLPHPKQPTFTIQSLSDADLRSQCNKRCSINKASLSIIEGQ